MSNLFQKDLKEIPVITAAGITDKGLVRENNEDNFYVDEKFGFFIASDGIGGRQAGEKASEVIVKVLPLQVASIIDKVDPVSALEKTIQFLSSQLREYADEVPSLRGAGATIVSCFIRNRKAFIAHLGDSRAYLMRRGIFEQLTEDHSIVSMLLRIGTITGRQAKTHPARHTITRYVGMKRNGLPDIRPVYIMPGDRILLCTDGLTDMLTDREIGQILLEENEPKNACKSLVKNANLAGGKDNITAVVIKYGEEKRRRNAKKIEKVRVKRFKPYEEPEEQREKPSSPLSEEERIGFPEFPPES